MVSFNGNLEREPYRTSAAQKTISKWVELDVGKITVELITVGDERYEFVVDGSGPPEGDFPTKKNTHPVDSYRYNETNRDNDPTYHTKLARQRYEHMIYYYANKEGYLLVPGTKDTVPWHQVKRFRLLKEESKVLRWNVLPPQES
ncbi:MAG: hypothetical protein KGH64_04280 [Candidatus Micrarchaeota archaeon]|nr:hypothetical protein [Candidatus Micrarchaeota archaeon]